MAKAEVKWEELLSGRPAAEYGDDDMMLSIESLIIAAYIDDCGILCRECGEAAGLPTSQALCDQTMQSDFGDEGVYCDECRKEIVAPLEVCPVCTKNEYNCVCTDEDKEAQEQAQREQEIADKVMDLPFGGEQ